MVRSQPLSLALQMISSGLTRLSHQFHCVETHLSCLTETPSDSDRWDGLAESSFRCWGMWEGLQATAHPAINSFTVAPDSRAPTSADDLADRLWAGLQDMQTGFHDLILAIEEQSFEKTETATHALRDQISETAIVLGSAKVLLGCDELFGGHEL